jgi:peptidoglycan/LPS O-acetylase OafA/YrhL
MIKMNQISHNHNLDILRGIAALFVVFKHGLDRKLWFGFVTGSTGVAIFFCLSGFLMGYLYSTKKLNFNNLVAYIISRFSRIAPAYLIVVILSFIVYNYFDSTFIYNIDSSNLLRHILFSGNVSVFWTIPPEVQFYAFFILVWLAVDRFKINNYLPLILVSVSIVLMLYFREDFPGTTLPSKLNLFIFGCIAGILRVNSIFSKFKISFINAALIALTTLIYGIYLENQYIGVMTYHYFHYALVCALGILLLSLNNNSNVSFFKRFFILIGKISFTLYLLHEVILFYYELANFKFEPYLNLIFVYSSVIFISYIFYEFIERPLNINLKNYLTKYTKRIPI